jgi:ATP-binding cassette, subfamily B, bacterial
MRKLIKKENNAFAARRRLEFLTDFPRSVITTLGVAAAFWLILSNTSGPKSATIALTVMTFSYLFQMMRHVDQLPEQINRHDDYILRIQPIIGYLGDKYRTIVDQPKPRRLNAEALRIDIDNLCFEYPHKNRTVKVFNDFNLTIQPGEHVGIVGLSGAGKSTLASLIVRFDDATSGSIKINGIDIREVRQRELHQRIAYVPQEPMLFHRSVKENIAYFNQGATLEQIEQAAKIAHAHGFITELPDGYNTVVGERGVKLSGGQKQRVVIARAILKKAPIMIFDEATSALDSHSEKIIQDALPEIISGKTTIVIAHRLSTIAGMDRIIVMHDGKVVEEGTHKQLLAQEGRYWSLWQRQTKQEIDAI